MLNITDNVLLHSTVISSNKNEVVNTKKLKEVIIIAFFDSLIVSGIVFFSTLVSSGYNYILIDGFKISATSAFIAGGLSFFSELKKSEKKIINHESDKR